MYTYIHIYIIYAYIHIYIHTRTYTKHTYILLCMRVFIGGEGPAINQFATCMREDPDGLLCYGRRKPCGTCNMLYYAAQPYGNAEEIIEMERARANKLQIIRRIRTEEKAWKEVMKNPY